MKHFAKNLKTYSISSSIQSQCYIFTGQYTGHVTQHVMCTDVPINKMCFHDTIYGYTWRVKTFQPYQGELLASPVFIDTSRVCVILRVMEIQLVKPEMIQLISYGQHKKKNCFCFHHSTHNTLTLFLFWFRYILKKIISDFWLNSNDFRMNQRGHPLTLWCQLAIMLREC